MPGELSQMGPWHVCAVVPWASHCPLSGFLFPHRKREVVIPASLCCLEHKLRSCSWVAGLWHLAHSRCSVSVALLLFTLKGNRAQC